MQQDTFLNLDQDYVHLTNGHFIRQRFAMMVLFFSCGGIFWEIEENDVSIPIDWAGNASEGECDWPLVQCDLHGVGMTSSIPNEIGMITTLKTCIFGKNRLEGTLPPSFFELTSLRMLDINSNDYYGSLPSALGYLTNLEDLQLDNNLFRGEIPVSFTNLSNLKSFHIENNREITGPILDMATWSWPRITLLSFSNTAITGTVPTTIGLLTDLAFLYAGDSTIRGSIPSEMGLLTKLSRLRLSGSIEGTLPSTIQNCASLVDVDLLFNDIIGTLPPDLSRLAAIEYIFLGRNKLMGTLPPEWKDLDNLVLLSLQRNNLSGSIPESWSSLTKLKVLSIHENPAMTGTIPSALCSSVDTIQWGCNLVCDCCASDCIQPKD